MRVGLAVRRRKYDTGRATLGRSGRLGPCFGEPMTNRSLTWRGTGILQAMQQGLGGFLPLAALCVLAGCQGGQYAATLREGTPASCLRFLERYPEGPRSAHVRQVLDSRRFNRARAADRPLGYHDYLRAQPDGRFVTAARQRLGELALARANDEDALVLVIERYRDAPAAKKARSRLADALAAAATASVDAEQIEAFLRDYAEHPRADDARIRLAALRYEGLEETVSELDDYVHRFGDTRWGKLAQRRLRDLLVREISASGDQRLLDQLAVRFPADPIVSKLAHTVQARRSWSALAAMDTEQLEILAAKFPEGPEAEVLTWCQRQPAGCSRALRLSKAAGPWRPDASLDELEGHLYEADAAQNWRAMDALSWLHHPRAGNLLLELVGSQRLATVWAAERALGAWLARLGRQQRQRWTATQLRKTPREVNHDEVQRWGYLAVRLGKAGPGLGHLRRLAATPLRALSAGYLLSRLGHREAKQALVAAASKRVAELKANFPAQLDSDSVAAATLMERDLFVMLEVSRTLAGSREAAQLVEDNRALLGTWRVRLARASPGFTAATFDSAKPAVVAHRRGRTRALAQLLATKDRPPRRIGMAVCSLIEIEVMDAPPSTAEQLARLKRRCRKTRGWK